MKTGTYFYKDYHPATNTFSNHQIRVEVLQSTAVSYQILLPSNVKSWVRKHHVKYIVDDSPKPVIPCTCINNDSIRLPYKN